MHVIIVKRDILTQLAHKGNLHFEQVKQQLQRYMELTEVPDVMDCGIVDYVRENRPGYAAFGIYVSFIRRAKHGLEIAKYNNDPQRNGWFGDWFELDGNDWETFTVKSNFDVTEMYGRFVQSLITELDSASYSVKLPIHQCYAVLDTVTDQELTPNASLATFIGVEMPMGINLGLEWVSINNIKDQLHPFDKAVLHTEVKSDGENK